MTPLEQLRALYFNATRASIGEDFGTAIDLFKQLASEADRERAAVFMDGMAEMRREWGADATRTKPGTGNRESATGNRQPGAGSQARGTRTSTRPRRR